MNTLRHIAILALLSLAATWAIAANDGKELFEERCAMCHGHDGRATNEMGRKIGAKDLASKESQALSVKQIQEQISKGKNRMPGYEGVLTDEEIKTLAKYVKTLK